MKNKTTARLYHKLLELVTAMFFLTLLIIIMAGFFPFKATWLKQKAVAKLVQSGADFCTIEGIVLIPYKSLTLNKLVIVKQRIDTLRQDTVKIEQVYFEGNMLSLLLHRKRISRELLSTDGDLFRFFSANPAAVTGLFESFVQRECKHIQSGSCTGITGAIELGTGQRIYVNNGSLLLGRVAKGDGDTWEATVTLPMVRTERDEYTNVRGQLLLAKEGKQLSGRWRGDYLGGKVNGSAALNLKKARIEEYQIDAENIDAGAWYRNAGFSGSIVGDADVELHGRAQPLTIDSINGMLTIVLKKCSFSGFPLQQMLVQSLAIKQLESCSFTKVKIESTFELRRPLEIAVVGSGNDLNFTTKGWISRDGSLNQQVECVFPEHIASRFPDGIRKSLEPAGKGDRLFRCRLYGTWAQPGFELDKAMLQRAMTSMFDDARNDFQKYISGK